LLLPSGTRTIRRTGIDPIHSQYIGYVQQANALPELKKRFPRVSVGLLPDSNRSTQNAGHLSRFIGLLTYKATLAGKRVIKIDERDTTRICCVCEAVHDMPLGKRVMDCDCGN
jgi:hypothetical protein